MTLDAEQLAFLEARKFSIEITQQPLHRRHHVGRLDAVELRKIPVVEKRVLPPTCLRFHAGILPAWPPILASALSV